MEGIDDESLKAMADAAEAGNLVLGDGDLESIQKIVAKLEGNLEKLENSMMGDGTVVTDNLKTSNENNSNTTKDDEPELDFSNLPGLAGLAGLTGLAGGGGGGINGLGFDESMLREMHAIAKEAGVLPDQLIDEDPTELVKQSATEILSQVEAESSNLSTTATTASKSTNTTAVTKESLEADLIAAFGEKLGHQLVEEEGNNNTNNNTNNNNSSKQEGKHYSGFEDEDDQDEFEELMANPIPIDDKTLMKGSGEEGEKNDEIPSQITEELDTIITIGQDCLFENRLDEALEAGMKALDLAEKHGMQDGDIYELICRAALNSGKAAQALDYVQRWKSKVESGGGSKSSRILLESAYLCGKTEIVSVCARQLAVKRFANHQDQLLAAAFVSDLGDHETGLEVFNDIDGLDLMEKDQRCQNVGTFFMLKTCADKEATAAIEAKFLGYLRDCSKEGAMENDPSLDLSETQFGWSLYLSHLLDTGRSKQAADLLQSDLSDKWPSPFRFSNLIEVEERIQGKGSLPSSGLNKLHMLIRRRRPIEAKGSEIETIVTKTKEMEEEEEEES